MKDFFTESQTVDTPEVSFTNREGPSTVEAVRLTATMRFQRKLGQLLEDRKKAGDKAAYGTLADYCERGAQSWVSNMLSEVRATQPNLEDLENIADFFRVSVNELFRPANPKDLSADEQRVLLAFRSVPDVVQTHFLALLEAASVSTNLSVGKRLRQLRKPPITSAVYGHPLQPDAQTAGRLAAIIVQLTELLQQLTPTPPSPDVKGPLPGAGPQPPGRRRVVT